MHGEVSDVLVHIGVDGAGAERLSAGVISYLELDGPAVEHRRRRAAWRAGDRAVEERRRDVECLALAHRPRPRGAEGAHGVAVADVVVDDEADGEAAAPEAAELYLQKRRPEVVLR